MNILKEIFGDFSTFIRYAPGVETNMNLDDLQSSGLTARKRVEAAISPAVLQAIMNESEGSPLMEALRFAVANMTMATQLIFDSINRRKNDVNIYKYELEAMHRSYTENYCNALDTILQLLMQTSPETTASTLWRESRYFSILADCEIRTMADFDMVYPIDGSYLFFFRTVPLQRETLDEMLSASRNLPMTTAGTSGLSSCSPWPRKHWPRRCVGSTSLSFPPPSVTSSTTATPVVPARTSTMLHSPLPTDSTARPANSSPVPTPCSTPLPRPISAPPLPITAPTIKSSSCHEQRYRTYI